VTIAGRFPESADGEGDRGVKTVLTVSPRARYSAIDTTGAAPATGRIWRVGWPRWRVSRDRP